MNDRIHTVMYQYSRAIYKSIKDLVDPYVDDDKRLEYRRTVLAACHDTVERLASDPGYFARPERALFQDIRRYFPMTRQAEVAWKVSKGIGLAVQFIEKQIADGVFDANAAHCVATTRKGKPCQRQPLDNSDYCPSHQHLARKAPRIEARPLTA
jgi:hypothetical protein